MKYLVPSLLILAGAPIFGASIADDLVIKPKVQVQVRAQFAASGTDTGAGTDGKRTTLQGGPLDTNIYNGGVGDNEKARFSLRRARFGAEATNSTGWYGAFQIRGGERTDAGSNVKVVDNTAPGGQVNQSRVPEVYYANVSKVFKLEGFDIDVHGGLDKPFNDESSISSSTFMFPTDSPVFHFIERRNVGAGVKATIQEMVKIGLDVQNGSSNKDNQDIDSGAPGLFYSGRIEVAPTKEMYPAKKMESYYGQEGTHLLVGFDFMKEDKQINSVSGNVDQTATKFGNDQVITRTIFGPDINAHWNAISFGAEYRLVNTQNDFNNPTLKTDGTASGLKSGPEDVKSSLFSIHAGYSIVLENGLVIEPAARFSVIDLDRDNNNGDTVNGVPTTQEAVGLFNQGEYRAGSSGREVTVAVTAYWNGHKNKTTLAYTSFVGEDLSLNATQQANAASGLQTFDAAKAKVVTLQHQITY